MPIEDADNPKKCPDCIPPPDDAGTDWPTALRNLPLPDGRCSTCGGTGVAPSAN